MLRLLVLLTTILGLAACQTTGGTAPTVADTVARVCPPVKAVLVVLENSPTVDVALKAKLKEVEPAVFIVCSGEINVDAVSLHELADKALPVMLEVVAAAPLTDDQKNYAVLSIAAAQAVIASVPK
jgi:hypothetical protein